jgi:hypothetical protein
MREATTLADSDDRWRHGSHELRHPGAPLDPMPFVGTEKRREKVVVLRELQRAIIYTRELSKQVTEGHVSTAFIGYSVDEGARLTPFLRTTTP